MSSSFHDAAGGPTPPIGRNVTVEITEEITGNDTPMPAQGMLPRDLPRDLQGCRRGRAERLHVTITAQRAMQGYIPGGGRTPERTAPGVPAVVRPAIPDRAQRAASV